MAIGMIDCTTTGKKLCNDYDVSGFPTLKFAINGVVEDYTFGRSEQDLLKLMNKITSLPVYSVQSSSEAYQYAQEKATDGIAFVAYHPDAAAITSGTMEDKMAASSLTRAFLQVARKKQAMVHFLFFDVPLVPATETEPVIDPAAQQFGISGPFVCRLAQNNPLRCFPKSNESEIDVNELLRFVTTQNVPTVSNFAAHTFRHIGSLGRPVVVGVIDDDPEQIDKMNSALFFTGISDEFENQYYYGFFSGKRWSSFLEQFNVMGGPQVIVVDMSKKLYWQSDDYWNYNVAELLRDIAAGKIESRKPQRKGVNGIIDMANHWMEDNTLMVSIIFVSVFFVFSVALAKWAATDEEFVAEEETTTTGKESKKEQ